VGFLVIFSEYLKIAVEYRTSAGPLSSRVGVSNPAVFMGCNVTEQSTQAASVTVALTVITLIAFASNSLLCRTALASRVMAILDSLCYARYHEEPTHQRNFTKAGESSIL